MIVVTVELWPHGNPSKEARKTLAQMVIANDGSGTMKRGNYTGSTIRKGTLKQQRAGRVENHARLHHHVWVLVRKMLEAMGY